MALKNNLVGNTGRPTKNSSSVWLLFKRGDPSDLARCVNEMLSSDETTEKARLGRERVLSKYTYDHNASDYIAVFERAIAKMN